MSKNKPRVCLACQNCRRRKVKCSGGVKCNECVRFNQNCTYREHYREKKSFAIKILQSPDFVKKEKEKDKSKLHSTLHNPPLSHPLHTATIPPSNLLPTLPAPQTLAPVLSVPTPVVVPAQIPEPKKLAPEGAETGERVEGETGKREPLGPANFLHKLNSFMESMLPMTTKPTYNIEQEATGLLNQLCRLPKPAPAAAHSMQSLHLTEEQMLQCLADYFNSYHVMIPMLDPDTWIRKAKSAWRTMEYGSYQGCCVELAIIYMVIALGCSGSFTMTFAGYEDQKWSREYSNRALALIPNILSDLSLRMVQYVLLRSIYEVSQGEVEVGYMYSGTMVRNLMALDIHRADPINPAEYEKHRTWLSAYTWEKLWSFNVGRPSCIGSEIPAPIAVQPAFINNTRYSMGVGHFICRTKFNQLCSSLSQRWAGVEHKTVLAMYELATQASREMESIISRIPDRHLFTDNVEQFDGLSDMDYKEWYWLRLFYWYIRLILYRPFLVLYTYTDVANCQDIGDISPDTIDALRQGTAYALEAALKIPPTVVKMDQKVERCQINWFTSLHLEAAGSVLLLYAVCQPPSQKVDQCVEKFNELIRYLNFGLAAQRSSEQGVMADDRITFITQLTRNFSIRRALAMNRCAFAKVFFMTRMPGANSPDQSVNADVSGGFQPTGKLDTAMLDMYWQRALALVGYR